MPEPGADGGGQCSRPSGIRLLVWPGRTGSGQNVPVTESTSTETPALDPAIAAMLKRDEHGLVAAIVQQHDSGEVLMLGWMDEEALRRTLADGRVTFWSRSRRAYWRKGDTSGHVQWVRGIRLDCDGDALLVQVDQVGAACHTGDRTCFDARVLPAVVGEGSSGESAESTG